MDLFHKNITESPLCHVEASKIHSTFSFTAASTRGPATLFWMPLQPTKILPWVSISLAVQHYHLKQTLLFWNKFTSKYLTPNVLPNQASCYLRAIYTYRQQVFSLSIGLWCLLLSPTPTPARTQVIFLAFTMELSLFFKYCIYSLRFHKAVCFILFFFSVLVLFLLSNE